MGLNSPQKFDSYHSTDRATFINLYHYGRAND